MPSQDAPDIVNVFTDLVKLLVDDPSNITISTAASPDGQTTLLGVEVANKEVGRLVGVSGRTARALRTILGNVSISQCVRYSLEIVEKHK